VLGLNDVPSAGDLFQVVPSEKDARALIETRKLGETKATSAPKITLEELFAKYQAGEMKELPLIVKADVQGSLEPIINSLQDLSKGDIKVNVLYAETGNIGENDVMLASASKAIIIGFNVQADSAARRLAESEGVSVRLYDIIYRLTEDIDKALKGMLEPEYKETTVGKAEVLAVFHITKLGNIAGCKVLSGELRRNGKIRVVRGNKTMHEGEMSSLKREKDDVREVRQGFECGVGLKNFDEFAQGDLLECYVRERVGQVS
jgi:translation initiation factor IF-2